MKIVYETNGPLTVKQLLDIVEQQKLPMTTKLYTMGAITTHVTLENGDLVLDECNYADECGEEYKLVKL